MNARLIALLAVAAEVADDPPAPVVAARRRVWVHSINRGRRQSTEARPPSSDEAVPLEGGRRLGTNNSTREVMQERERFMTYFNSAAGEVSWQNNVV
ncbi:unnamed protein product [Boreogadus saida]